VGDRGGEWKGEEKKDERKEKRRREGGENPYQNTFINNLRKGVSRALGSKENPDLQKIVQPSHRDIVNVSYRRPQNAGWT